MPDFKVPTTVDYDLRLTPAPGAFRILKLGGAQNPGASEEADWILQGYNKYLPVNQDYRSDPGAKFSSGGNVQAALAARKNTVLLFPVYETLGGTGQNATYYVIGWIGFYLQDYTIHGNTASLSGYFVQYIAQGILASSGGAGPPNYGVKSIQLIG